ncbi:DNA repair protein RecO [Thermaerobacter composti]|uniref:DNA repair protein RecO n=1 Tax=Thermaerobacter composti TaxID=554949 RepID=A0ABZ0QQF0_9FIRM|nr:DNA repair protein RecO [Thermaerobacter composti]PZN07116.1 MAG: DNA repair protein RecO [Bacillota bacterium]WPD18909.1 DNA repair protein RecO [Thermaerobacter composti]
MPLYTVEGVVLRTREYGERDRLVTLLDREGVRRTVLAKGVRRPKSSLAAGVQPYTHSRFLLWKGRSLDGVSQVQVLEALTGLRASLEALAAAAYVAELAEAFTQEGAASPGVFPVVLAVLRRLDAAPADGRVHALWLRHAELRLLDLAGLGMQLDACQGCGRPLAAEAAPTAAAGDPRPLPGAGRPAAYSAEAGGVLCERCAPERPAALPLDPATWQVLRRVRRLTPTLAARLRPGDAVLARAAEVVQTHLVYHLGRPFRSHGFLAILEEARWSSGAPR